MNIDRSLATKDFLLLNAFVKAFYLPYTTGKSSLGASAQNHKFVCNVNSGFFFLAGSNA